jgi:hypothetical protein
MANRPHKGEVVVMRTYDPARDKLVGESLYEWEAECDDDLGGETHIMSFSRTEAGETVVVEMDRLVTNAPIDQDVLHLDGSPWNCDPANMRLVPLLWQKHRTWRARCLGRNTEADETLEGKAHRRTRKGHERAARRSASARPARGHDTRDAEESEGYPQGGMSSLHLIPYLDLTYHTPNPNPARIEGDRLYVQIDQADGREAVAQAKDAAEVARYRWRREFQPRLVELNYEEPYYIVADAPLVTGDVVTITLHDFLWGVAA